MDVPLAAPRKSDPQKRTRPPLLPPMERSRAALSLVRLAARGVFGLQVCRDCEAVIYPPRDACPRCLSGDLVATPLPEGGTALAETTVRVSRELYFRERPPTRIGTVALDAGPSAIAFLHPDVAVPGRVRVAHRLDIAGNPVMMALPEEDTPHMQDAPTYRELTASPRHRRVLVTDGRSAAGRAIAKALLGAGAARVFLGVAELWKGFPEAAEFEGGAVDVVPLDLTDGDALTQAAGSIGGKVDILVNTADHTRPGGLFGSDVNRLVDTFDTNVFGLARLAQAFGPAMRARGADGTGNAVAILDIVPVHALASWPRYAALSASAAARHSLLQALRAELRGGGVRAMAVFVGPMDDAWHTEVDPPKVGPAQLARGVVTALEQGLEESVVGDVARDVLARWDKDPKVLERELSQ